MPETATPRHAMPLLVTGQADKELTHNEALTVIDALLHPAFAGVASVPPSAPMIGDCWRIGPSPSGDWQDMDGDIAVWTGGGWRFITPVPGMTATDRSSLTQTFFNGTSWSKAQTIGAVAGGTVIDVEARTALAQIIVALHSCGLIR